MRWFCGDASEGSHLLFPLLSSLFIEKLLRPRLRNPITLWVFKIKGCRSPFGWAKQPLASPLRVPFSSLRVPFLSATRPEGCTRRVYARPSLRLGCTRDRWHGVPNLMGCVGNPTPREKGTLLASREARVPVRIGFPTQPFRCMGTLRESKIINFEDRRVSRVVSLIIEPMGLAMYVKNKKTAAKTLKSYGVKFSHL